MRIIALLALLVFGAIPKVHAQTPPKPPVIFAPPITPDDGKSAASSTPQQPTTTLPVNPADVHVQVRELVFETKGKPFKLPALAAAGSRRDDLQRVNAVAARASLATQISVIVEADAPDGGVGNGSRTASLPAGFVLFPDGHQGYNPVATDQTTAISLVPKLQKDGTIQVQLRLSFTEITQPAAPKTKPATTPVKPKSRDFRPPVAVLVTAYPDDTVLIGQPEISKTTEKLLFATVTILPPTQE